MSEELKKALSEAKTEEKKKAAAEKFKDEIMVLRDEVLDGVVGGTRGEDDLNDKSSQNEEDKEQNMDRARYRF